MKFQLLLFFCGMIAGLSAKGLTMKDWQVEAGGAHTCVLDDSGVYCWGSVQTKAPSFKNPRQVSAGRSHNCALDNSGVHCWGYNEDGQTDVPRLQNPTQISAGNQHSCAVDDNGIHCWGKNASGQADVPTLKNPRQVSAGWASTCALDDNGVHCWGDNQFGQTDVPALQNPRQVSTGGATSCALDDDGVHCWGENGLDQTDIPLLKNPRQVSAGGNHVCAIDDGGVHCWGDKAYGQSHVPALKNPRHVSAGMWHSCAIDDDGVHCWGSNSYGEIDVPIATAFSLFQRLQSASPVSHFIYYEELKNLASTFYSDSEKSDENEYFFYHLLRPAIVQTDTEFYHKVLIPHYQQYILNLRQEASLPVDIQKLKDSAKRRQIALKHIQASLKVAFEFFSTTEKSAFQPLIQLIGTASADARDANVKAVLQELERNRSAISTLKKSERLAFLVDVIDLAASWLKAKVQ